MFGLFSKIPSTQAYECKRHLRETMYARYHDIKKSENFIRYEELKHYVASPEYKTELNHIQSLSYKTSKEYIQERRYKELKQYKEVKSFRKSGVDSDSDYVKEYIELENKVTAPSFRQRKAYLLNKKRHQQSDPYQKYTEYKRLKKSDFVKQYNRIRDKYTAVFAEMEKWETVFCDEFHQKQLSANWDTKPYWSMAMLAQNYSHNTEEHYLSDGQNVLINGDALQIMTRKEPAAGVAWDGKMGFIPREFPYTSGMISTAQHVEMGYGRLEAKLCMPNVKNVYGAFWLGSQQQTPAISIANYCNKRLVMGAYLPDRATAFTRKWKLKSNHFYIFQLERTPETLTWYVNGKQIAACPNPISEKLYVAFAAGVVGATNDSKLPVPLSIDYVQMQVRK